MSDPNPPEPPESSQPPVDDSANKPEVTESVPPDPAHQPGHQAKAGELAGSLPPDSARKSPIEKAKADEAASFLPTRALPQPAAETPERLRGGSSGHFATAINLLAALANIAMAFFNFQAWQGAPKDTERQDEIIRMLKDAVASIDEAKQHLAQGGQETILMQKGAVAALDEAVKILDDMSDTQKTISIKVPIVEGVFLGRMVLAQGPDGRYEVSSFASCPQVKIKLRNPGDLPVGGILRVSGRKGQDPFSCNEKLTRRLQPNAEVDIQFDLNYCLLHVEEITSCDGSGWLTVKVLED